MSSQRYITTIGLEVHLQLSTKTKAFCNCCNEFGGKPNSRVCPVCLGFPGSLPVLNKEYLRSAIKVALAMNCKVTDIMRFDRKNYFYPDLPKNYQISQYDMPLSKDGFLEVATKHSIKRIGITRLHMEEDAGRLIHEAIEGVSLIDYNRSGTPLLEIVSEPDISSPDEAYSYLTTLKAILEYLTVSDCDMEKGSLRCDANISVRPAGQEKFGEKVELKNMNSFKGAKMALEYEEARQIEVLSSKKKVIRETRLWDASKKITEPMRTKEEICDYRYFPEPDLPPFLIERHLVEEVSKTLPELPHLKRARFVKEYHISEYDASCLVSDKAMSTYFELCVNLYPRPKTIVNWLTGDVSKYLNENNIEFKALDIKPQTLTEMLSLIDNGTISGKIAKDVLAEMLSKGKSAKEIVNEKGLVQISDEGLIEKIAEKIISRNKDVVEEYISGKDKALMFLVGEVMKETKGKANPGIVNAILKAHLQRKRQREEKE